MLLAMGFGAAQFKNHILLERENLLASIGNQQENHCTRKIYLQISITSVKKQKSALV
jgi:hypothetical protein